MPADGRVGVRYDEGGFQAMMALLFLLFLAAVVSALLNRERLAIAVFAVAMVASLFWFHHHATSVLAIQL